MQTASFRNFVLAAVLLAGAAAYVAVGETHGMGAPRWPDTEAVYATDGQWSTSSQKVEHSANNTDLVTRVFRNSNGTTATLTLVTNQAPKLYGAGAEVPFLGNGYVVEPASLETFRARDDGVQALVARRGGEQWLMLYAYGERRGLLGNGVVPWTLAVVDGLMGRPNDYYKMYLMVRADRLDADVGGPVADLARTVFPRIAGWYAS